MGHAFCAAPPQRTYYRALTRQQDGVWKPCVTRPKPYCRLFLFVCFPTLFPPGIGSEEVQPFSMSLEAEMMLEQLKEQHHQEMEVLQNQLESKVSHI